MQASSRETRQSQNTDKTQGTLKHLTQGTKTNWQKWGQHTFKYTREGKANADVETNEKNQKRQEKHNDMKFKW